MDLNSHKDIIEGGHEAHPVLGTILLFGGFTLGIFSLAMEQSLSDVNLLLAIGLKLLSIASILLSVVIYWDKIKANFKQFKSDVKEKLQRKK